jgi:hypothetical protein
VDYLAIGIIVKRNLRDFVSFFRMQEVAKQGACSAIGLFFVNPLAAGQCQARADENVIQLFCENTYFRRRFRAVLGRCAKGRWVVGLHSITLRKKILGISLTFGIAAQENQKHIFVANIRNSAGRCNMKRYSFCLAFVAALALLLGGVQQARAGTVITTMLSGAGETPPTTSLALGMATYDIHDDHTAIDFHIVFGANFGSPPLTTPLVAGHIHFGTPDAAGPVILPFPNLPLGMTSGDFSGVLTAANLTPAGPIMTFEDAIEALEAGNTYTNLHSTMFPGGEIRGQNPQTVPEPTSLTLLGIGLAGMAGYAWRRRKPAVA